MLATLGGSLGNSGIKNVNPIMPEEDGQEDGHTMMPRSFAVSGRRHRHQSVNCNFVSGTPFSLDCC